MPEIDVPIKPTDNKVEENPTLLDINQLKLKEYIKEEKLLNIALISIWAGIWGQYSTSICTKLEKKKDIKELKRKANIVEKLAYNQQACKI